jgi:hypothetical protein
MPCVLCCVLHVSTKLSLKCCVSTRHDKLRTFPRSMPPCSNASSTSSTDPTFASRVGDGRACTSAQARMQAGCIWMQRPQALAECSPVGRALRFCKVCNQLVELFVRDFFLVFILRRDFRERDVSVRGRQLLAIDVVAAGGCAASPTPFPPSFALTYVFSRERTTF